MILARDRASYKEALISARFSPTRKISFTPNLYVHGSGTFDARVQNRHQSMLSSIAASTSRNCVWSENSPVRPFALCLYMDLSCVLIAEHTGSHKDSAFCTIPS